MKRCVNARFLFNIRKFRISSWFSVIVKLSLLFNFLTITIWWSSLDEILTATSNREFEASLQILGPLMPKDEALIKLVKERYLRRPSNEKYNFHAGKEDKFSKGYSKIALTGASTSRIIKNLRDFFPKGQSGEKGFFVEAGALDGEMGSNTLYLEKELGWTGLLVEPDSEMYRLLASKHRKAWSCNCCLSTKPYPFRTTLIKLTQPFEHFDAPISQYRGLNFIREAGLYERLSLGYASYEEAQCLPLETLLISINVSTINYFSLDVEGSEIEILHQFPWGEVLVDVWTIEHTYNNSLGDNPLNKEFIQWFCDKGYSLFEADAKQFPTDYTFIRNGSDVHKRAFDKRL